MAIFLESEHPDYIINNFLFMVNHSFITTWIIDDANDLTINNVKWRCKAWFRLYRESNRLIFGIISSKKYPLTKEIYGVYHGRLAATLLANFDTLIRDFRISSQLDSEYDIF